MKRLNKSVVLLLFTNLFILGALAQKANISPETFIASAIPDSLKENANYVVRYYNKELTVKSAGKAVIREHSIQTLLNEKAENETALVLYHSKYIDINAAELVVYDSQGKLIKRYKKGDFFDRLASDETTLVSDGRFLGKSHTVVSYPVTIEKISEITLNSFLDLFDWKIQEQEVAVQHAACKVLVRPEVGFRYKLKNFSKAPVKGNDGDFETYTWEVNSLKAIKPEEGSQPWAFLPRISFATNAVDFDDHPGDMSTWKGFGLWQQKLNEGLDVLPEKRVQEIQKMVAGIPGDKEKAKFLYEYMQKNTRYVGIQLGIGGLRPFPASFVDQKKYGDCKALSNYMHTLLKCVNINSYYTIINSGYNDEVADPDFVNDPFNHIILCIPFKGDTTWLECTSNTHPFGKLGPSTENRKALLVTEEGGKLVNTPKSSLNDNVFESESRIEISPEGIAKGSLKIKSTGEYRNLLLGMATVKTDEQKQFLIRFLNLKQPDIFDLKETTDTDGIREIELALEYEKLSDLATGGKFFFRPRLFDLWRATLPLAEKRSTDYFFDHPMLKKSNTVISIPTDLEVETMPADVALKFSYGKYEVKYLYDKEKNEIKSTAVFELNNHIIPSAKYTEMQQFMDNIAKSMSKKMILRKKA